MELKRLLKRGALIVGANWQTVVLQFLARTTFQALLAIPVVGTAVVIAVLVGANLARLLEGGIRDILSGVMATVQSEPIALAAFGMAFGTALLAGTALMAFVKGATVGVLVKAEAETGPFELEPLFLDSFRHASRVSMPRLIEGGTRHFRRFLVAGILQLLVYGVSAAAGVVLLVYTYTAAEGFFLVMGWAIFATLAAAVLAVWITIVTLFHQLMQVVIVIDGMGVLPAFVRAVRFVRSDLRSVGSIFLVLLVILIVATLAAALAWSGVALVAFVPLVGLAVVPLQIAAFVVRGLLFEYIALIGLEAYVALYRRNAGYPAAASDPTVIGPRSISATG
ncbi:MAG: hypothetical protein AB7F99_00765 [Vicinamibacterales bacterium]